MPQSILEMAKELVQAQIEAGQLSVDDMPEALQQTHTILLALKSQEETGAGTTETPQISAATRNGPPVARLKL